MHAFVSSDVSAGLMYLAPSLRQGVARAIEPEANLYPHANF